MLGVAHVVVLVAAEPEPRNELSITDADLRSLVQPRQPVAQDEERPATATDEEFVPEVAAYRALNALGQHIDAWPVDVPFDALISSLDAKLHYLRGINRKRKAV